jgi:hypothetical protein
MKNKILKYYDFIKEELSDTPQSYIKNKLKQLQKAFNDLFEDESENDEDSEFISIEDAKKNKKSDKKLSDLGVKMDSSEISLYSQTDDSLTIKYSDDEASYTMIIFINIKEGLEKGNNFSEDDIKKIDVKFKKYLNDIDLIGETRYSIDIDRKNGEFMFSVSKDEKEGQSQNNQEPVESQEESVDKMSLLEFLEFLKTDFDDKYGDDSEKLLINKD